MRQRASGTDDSPAGSACADRRPRTNLEERRADVTKGFAVAIRFMVIVCTTTTVGFLANRAAAARTVRGRLRGIDGDSGMSTAEYAVGTIAACAFAAVLYQVVTGDSIVSALQDLIDSALSTLS